MRPVGTKNGHNEMQLKVAVSYISSGFTAVGYMELDQDSLPRIRYFFPGFGLQATHLTEVRK
jgi:hypothetical protein